VNFRKLCPKLHNRLNFRSRLGLYLSRTTLALLRGRWDRMRQVPLFEIRSKYLKGCGSLGITWCSTIQKDRQSPFSCRHRAWSQLVRSERSYTLALPSLMTASMEANRDFHSVDPCYTQTPCTIQDREADDFHKKFFQLYLAYPGLGNTER
jgi:hypothetical protein